MELNHIVYQKVQRGNYPPLPQPLDEQIWVKRNEIYALKAEKVPRPSTKKEYLDLLTSLEQEVKDLVTKQETDKSTYDAECSVINNTYNDEIAAAKLDEANIWKAIRNYRNYLLSQCDWTDTVSAQTRLSTTEKEQWNKYRQELRDIPKSFSSPKDVIFPTINVEV